MVSEEASHGGCTGCSQSRQSLSVSGEEHSGTDKPRDPTRLRAGRFWDRQRPTPGQDRQGSLFSYSHPHRGTCHKFLALPPGRPAAPSLLISREPLGLENLQSHPGGCPAFPHLFIHPSPHYSLRHTDSLSLSPSRMVKGLYLAAWEPSPASHALSPRCTQGPSKQRWCAEGWHAPPPPRPVTFLLPIEAMEPSLHLACRAWGGEKMGHHGSCPWSPQSSARFCHGAATNHPLPELTYATNTY